jgi:phosphatidate phosphatase PAH1
MDRLKTKYFEPRFNPNWKKDDIIICIQNAGKSKLLTIGEEYRVIDAYTEYGADEVLVVPTNGNCLVCSAFSSRFTTLKRQRKEKLKKLKIQ